MGGPRPGKVLVRQELLGRVLGGDGLVSRQVRSAEGRGGLHLGRARALHDPGSRFEALLRGRLELRTCGGRREPLPASRILVRAGGNAPWLMVVFFSDSSESRCQLALVMSYVGSTGRLTVAKVCRTPVHKCLSVVQASVRDFLSYAPLLCSGDASFCYVLAPSAQRPTPSAVAITEGLYCHGPGLASEWLPGVLGLSGQTRTGFLVSTLEICFLPFRLGLWLAATRATCCTAPTIGWGEH